MTTANVNNVVIQLIIPSNITDSSEQRDFVLNTISLMNKIIDMSELEAHPQILTSGIDEADIDTYENLNGDEDED